ncbi:unnamed protein product [Prorocentrum cordatum]|uniref:Uncharacterized protein n=1 Tax=Prorocentrum cordatum TaxID=2364126 RepID=A0ABN9SBM9_9DINO|nr:unnamed protein product [Polarella glacialis]
MPPSRIRQHPRGTTLPRRVLLPVIEARRSVRSEGAPILDLGRQSSSGPWEGQSTGGHPDQGHPVEPPCLSRSAPWALALLPLPHRRAGVAQRALLPSALGGALGRDY